MEGKGSAETSEELDGNEGGRGSPDGEQSGEGAGHVDGEFLDTSIHQFKQK